MLWVTISFVVCSGHNWFGAICAVPFKQVSALRSKRRRVRVVAFALRLDRRYFFQYFSPHAAVFYAPNTKVHFGVPDSRTAYFFPSTVFNSNYRN